MHRMSTPAENMIPLTDALEGDELELVEIRGGIELQHRLTEMSLRAGATFTLTSRVRPGPYIIQVKGTKFMLGRGMIDRLFVRRVTS
jgi:Fe2+ transport system protein FeoA